MKRTIAESELKKKSGTYNVYSLTLSFGQLQAIISRLELDHADPVSDELLAELKWMVDNAVPGPGEEEEDLKAREEQEKELADRAHTDAEEDFPLPMPPGEEPGPETSAEGEELEGPPEEPGSLEDEGEPELEPEPAAFGESIKHEADRLLAAPR